LDLNSLEKTLDYPASVRVTIRANRGTFWA